MRDELDPMGTGGDEEAPRQIEESSTAPRPIESEGSSVEADDSVNAEDAPVLSGDGNGDDPWSEVMQDLARLVIGAFEADPQRFK